MQEPKRFNKDKDSASVEGKEGQAGKREKPSYSVISTEAPAAHQDCWGMAPQTTATIFWMSVRKVEKGREWWEWTSWWREKGYQVFSIPCWHRWPWGMVHKMILSSRLFPTESWKFKAWLQSTFSTTGPSGLHSLKGIWGYITVSIII